MADEHEPADPTGNEPDQAEDAVSGTAADSEETAPESGSGSEPSAAETAAAQAPRSREDTLLDELQRLAAEYKNYRQRTEAQRELDRQRATGDIAKQLFGVLDDLDRAQAHDDLPEGSAFATVAAKIRGIGTKIGLAKFGEPGDAFDPQEHEAVMQVPSPQVSQQEILEVVAPGYRLGEVLLRAAKVVVAMPPEGDSATAGVVSETSAAERKTQNAAASADEAGGESPSAK
jgi:molecular chaperone GrpE